MTDTIPSSNLVTFYGKMLTFSRIKIATDDFDIIRSHLATVSPTKNSLIPIVIDSDVDIDLKKLVELLWSWGLQPIGVVKGLLNEQAKTMKIALFPADGKRIKKIPQTEKIISVPVVEKTEVPEENTKKETDTADTIKQTESVNQSIVKDDIDTDKFKKPSKNEGLETSLITQTTLNEEKNTNAVSENEIKTIVEKVESTTDGLFGKTDRAKIFGEKVIASNNILSASSNSFEQKNSSIEAKKKSIEDSEVNKIPALEAISSIEEVNDIAEVLPKETSTTVKKEHEAEKQAEEKIKRFSSRAEVIAKINEANKSKDDNTESHESADTCEAPEKEINESNLDLNKDESNNQAPEKEIYLSQDGHLKSDNTDKIESKATKAENNKEETDKPNKKPELTEQTKVRVEYVTVYENEKITSRVYDQVLRSGQSINHVGGDLILTNSVNDGAEAITDNSLHIYGRGMGRLVAGATGDQAAQIFCQKFNPSLVSVAGTYMLRDNLPTEVIDKAVQVSYKDGEGLLFRVMDN